MENSSILFPHFALIDVQQQEHGLLEKNSSDSVVLNDYMQQHIFDEIRRNNTEIEILRHFLVISGSIFSIFGIFGNSISLMVLLKPLSVRILNLFGPRNPNRPYQRSSFDYKLSTFYTYLTALSFCDLFSCIFAILNVIQYINPPYINFYSIRFHQVCLAIALVTHPMAITFQTLSVWVITVFSIHRANTIMQTESDVSDKTFKRNREASIFIPQTIECDDRTNEEENQNDYLFSIYLHNRFNHKTYNVKCKPTGMCTFCFCNKNTNKDSNEATDTLNFSTHRSARKNLNRARLNIFFLFLFGLIYLIPQMFEKKLIYIDIENRTYVFTKLTQFGQTKLYRQIFHLWFYLIAVYIIPFVLILVFNMLLLRTYLKSKKKCERYKPKRNPTLVINDFSSIYSNGNNNNNNTYNEANRSLSEAKFTERSRNQIRALNISFKSSLRSKAQMRDACRNRSLTLTLFGVVAIFFICHLPAAITKITYVLFPKVEFEKNSVFASVFLDISNFLIMLNSSINFLLYIVLGPSKFREEFWHVTISIFKFNFKHSDNLKRERTILKLDSTKLNKKVRSSFELNSTNKLNQSQLYSSNMENSHPRE